MSLITIVKLWYTSTFNLKRLIDVQTTGSSLASVVVAVNDQTSLRVFSLFSSNCEEFFKSKANFHKLTERIQKKFRIKH